METALTFAIARLLIIFRLDARSDGHGGVIQLTEKTHEAEQKISRELVSFAITFNCFHGLLRVSYGFDGAKADCFVLVMRRSP